MVQQQLAFQFSTAEQGTGSLADGDRYRTDDGGYDVGRRLADLRAQYPDLLALDPASTLKHTDECGRLARTLGWSLGGCVLAYLVIVFVWSRRRRRSELAGDLELIPQPWISAPKRRAAVTLALADWVLAILMPAPQTSFAQQEQRSQALASRGAERISISIAASNLLQGFIADNVRSEVAVNVEGSGGNSVLSTSARRPRRLNRSLPQPTLRRHLEYRPSATA